MTRDDAVDVIADVLPGRLTFDGPADVAAEVVEALLDSHEAQLGVTCWDIEESADSVVPIGETDPVAATAKASTYNLGQRKWRPVVRFWAEITAPWTELSS